MYVRSQVIKFMERYTFHFLMTISLLLAAYYAYFYYKYKIYVGEIWGLNVSEIGNENTRELVRGMKARFFMAKNIYLSLVLIFLLAASLIAYMRHSQINNKNIIDRLEWTINRLSAMEGLEPDAKAHDIAERWPWGSHHTDALGHLEAAASRFWKLYDATDQSTAPTNEMVAEWLRDERGVSKEKAYAIASILRADGLKTGPRR